MLPLLPFVVAFVAVYIIGKAFFKKKLPNGKNHPPLVNMIGSAEEIRRNPTPRLKEYRDKVIFLSINKFKENLFIDILN